MRKTSSYRRQWVVIHDPRRERSGEIKALCDLETGDWIFDSYREARELSEERQPEFDAELKVLRTSVWYRITSPMTEVSGLIEEKTARVPSPH